MKEQISKLTISTRMMMATIASYCVEIDIHVTNVLIHKNLLLPFHLQQKLVATFPFTTNFGRLDSLLSSK
jgi:hypothetical protein